MKPNRCTNKPKTIARQATVVNQYFHLFGRNQLPTHKQYWTLCNAQTKDENSELTQLINIGLITEQQFYGVDTNKKLIEENQKVFPKATFICDDMYYAMLSHSNFNPGIIYFDSIGGIDTQKDNIGYILNLLYDRNIEDTMIVFNFVMKHRAVDDSEKYIMNEIESDSMVQNMLHNDAKLNYELLPMMYRSTNADMFTLVFTR